MFGTLLFSILISWFSSLPLPLYSHGENNGKYHLLVIYVIFQCWVSINYIRERVLVKKTEIFRENP